MAGMGGEGRSGSFQFSFNESMSMVMGITIITIIMVYQREGLWIEHALCHHYRMAFAFPSPNWFARPFRLTHVPELHALSVEHPLQYNLRQHSG